MYPVGPRAARGVPELALARGDQFLGKGLEHLRDVDLAREQGRLVCWLRLNFCCQVTPRR